MCGGLTLAVLQRGVAVEAHLASLTAPALRVEAAAQTLARTLVTASHLVRVNVAVALAASARASGVVGVAEVSLSTLVASSTCKG